MLPTGITPPATTLQLSPQLAQRLALVPDTLIEARVTDVKGQQVTLQIGQQTLTARSDIPLQPGQTHIFRVQFHNGQWQLQLQPQTTTAARAVQLPTPPPPAMPPQQALAQLAPLLGSAESGTALAGLVNQLGKLLIRDTEQLTPRALRQRLANSGVLLENRLSRNASVAQDAKGILLRLLQQLPDERQADIRATTALIRHIEQHQLNNLRQDWFGFPLLFAPDSPVQHAQVWLRAAQPDWQTGTPLWQALLQLDLRHSGLLEALIVWQADRGVDITFWTPNDRLKQQLEAAQDMLSTQLNEASVTFSERPLANTAQSPQTVRVSV